MSKLQINTKSRDYQKDKEVFLKELKQFNESKGIPYKIPTVNGIYIDLYLFYSLVLQRGGLSKVNYTNAWDSFMKPLRLPHPCINGSTLLRKIYGTYLEKFEKAKGPPNRDDDNDLDDDPRRSRHGGFPRVSYSGAYISASGEQLKPASRTIAGPSERLALSLLSPMPNEQDFCINVCTVLAADYSNRLPLSTTPHILDFLLAHAGVYNHSSLRDTIGRSYFEARGRYPDDFWKLRAGGGGARELADETKFGAPGLEQPDLMLQAMAAQNNLTDRLTMDDVQQDQIEKILEEEALEDWVTEPSDEDQLFAPELPGGAKCVYTQRVLQIASIVRSLSFHEENIQYLARNTTLIRFLLLCSNCWVGTLRQSGLDTLGNVCTELLIKDPATCLISRHVLSTIQSALVASDRARVLAALEMLNKLSQNEANEEVLLRALEAKVYTDVCALITLRDIMVLVCTLECVYALTSLGERASECVARVPGLISALIALSTVEAQSYGPRACVLMRVVETVSGASALAEQQQQQQQQQQQAAQAQQQQVQQPPQTPPKAPVERAAVPQPPAPAQAQAPAAPALSTIQQAHLQQRTVQENEQFALAWLRASYEPLPPTDNSGCDAADLYRQYTSCCAKMSRKGVIAPAHFPRLVRTVFGGTVGPTTVTVSTGETQQLYVGIRCKNPPNKSNVLAGPASPILKAQLTNKTGGAEAKPVIQQVQQQQQPHPHLSQALETGASSTSLIKHLLAHKVSPAAPAPAQVAQRQQNQQRIGPAASNTIVVQPNQTTMEVDPEALIKCTTIIPGGAASSTPGALDGKFAVTSGEEPMVPKDEPMDDQMTFKSAQNKMLADLLEKKSNPPVQVVQMATSQMNNAPTIQITETGQIVQVKQDNAVVQISDAGQLVSQSGPYFQIKNEQGQVIQLKNEQGHIIQLKSEQSQSGLVQGGQIIQQGGQILHQGGQIIQQGGQIIQQGGQIIQQGGQIIQQGGIIQQGVQIIQQGGQFIQQGGIVQGGQFVKEIESVISDHSYTEPPAKKPKMEEKKREEVSKTAANLYAALAASALEDEDDLVPQTQQAQQPSLQVQQPTLQIQQPTMQVQQGPLHVSQATMQLQQPMLQVQPMDVQNILASQQGQLILQDNKIMTQTSQFGQQQMQIITAPGNSQGGISYLTPNIPGSMMQKTIIIVQGATGGGPITLTVNNPGGLDEATLNNVIAQATEAITQQQIIQNTPQLTPSQQPIITTQPQPIKAQIMGQNQQQIVVTQKQPPALITTNSQGNQVIQGSQVKQQGSQVKQQGSQVKQQGSQVKLQGSQQILVSNNQQIMANAPMKTGLHRVSQPQRTQGQSDNKTTVIQSTGNSKTGQPMMRQVITRQPVMMGGTKIGDKELVVNTPITDPPVPQLVPSKPKTPTPSPKPAVAVPQEDTPWICHWKGCGKAFESASSVFNHCARTHCPPSAAGEAPCLWLDCDRVPRKTFALLNHLNDRHCTADALKAVYNSRKTASEASDSSKPVSLGYPPNAALQALNKHAVDTLNPRELMEENEGPVTKSIRLTAALILRNLVIYSNTGRRHLRSYESHLATIALSNVEASRTMAQVLYDMNNI